MAESTELDVLAAHRHFAAACFNQAWDLIDKPDRTAAEDEQMLLLALASLWHWTQRDDCTAQTRSVGYWQVSRVYVLLGDAENARAWALRCLEASRGEGVAPFYLGYAYEALARAERLAGNRDEAHAALRHAHASAGMVPDLEARQMLLADLDSIEA